MQFLEDLRITGHFLKFVENPNDTRRVFEVMRITREGPYHKYSQNLTVQYCLRNSEFRKMAEARYFPKSYTKEDLSTCPEGSLGRELYNHLASNNLDLEFYPGIEVEDDITYLILRLYQQHDLWHVITGYDTSVVGEMALQAFTFAQINSGGNLMILAAGMLNIGRKSPDEQGILFEKIVEGYHRGKKAVRPMLSLALEDHLETPIAEVREILGVCTAA